jgi:chromate transport protein ChrA
VFHGVVAIIIIIITIIVYKILASNLKGRDHSEDLGIDGKIILEWNLGT